MSNNAPNVAWKPSVEKTDGPMYLFIAKAISNDIERGVLEPGQRLPPQRALAEVLGIDFTTVSRAYALARKEGLVEGRVGHGTYIKDRRVIAAPHAKATSDPSVDTSMNMPPQFDDAGLIQEMWGGFSTSSSEIGSDLLMRYQTPGGCNLDRSAGKRWLDDHFDLQHTDNVLTFSGVQSAVWAILKQIAGQNDTVCCEALCYPGFLALAKHLNLNVRPIEMDDGGLNPDALAAACEKARPKAVYLTPTLHNPTTVTMSKERRRRIVEVARKYELQIIEDDAYGVLAQSAPQPIAHYGADVTWYISTLSKCLAPSLRVCYVLPPSGASNEGLKRAIRANGSMASPLTAALATQWITSGLANRITLAIRAETQLRQQAFSKVMPDIKLQADAFHVWLELPEEQSATEFVLRTRGFDIGLVPSVAFSLYKGPNAVRIALGSSPTMLKFESGLRKLADALNTPDADSWMVV